MNRREEIKKELEELMGPPKTRIGRAVEDWVLWYGNLFSRPDDQPLDRMYLGVAGIQMSGMILFGAGVAAYKYFF